MKQKSSPKEQNYDNMFCTKCYQMINYLAYQAHICTCKGKFNQNNLQQKQIPKNNLSQMRASKFFERFQSKISNKKQQNRQQELPITCSNCGQYIPIQQLDDHPKKCKYPVVKCQYCNIEYSYEMIQQHQQICVSKLQLQQLRKQQKLEKQQFNQQNIQNIMRQFQKLELNQDQQLNQNNLIQQLVLKSEIKEKGLTLNQIKSLKEQYYRKMKKQQQICSICYCPFKIHQKVINLKCKHTFHANCLKIWLKQSRKCPVCKQKVI